MSVKSEDDSEAKQEQILEAEERAKGNLKWAVIWAYLRSVQSWAILFLAVTTLTITQAAATFTDYWLSLWLVALSFGFCIS